MLQPHLFASGENLFSTLVNMLSFCASCPDCKHGHLCYFCTFMCTFVSIIKDTMFAAKRKKKKPTSQTQICVILAGLIWAELSLADCFTLMLHRSAAHMFRLRLFKCMHGAGNPSCWQVLCCCSALCCGKPLSDCYCSFFLSWQTL